MYLNCCTVTTPVKYVHAPLLPVLWYNIYIQVKKKFCELKRGNIGIVEKAQETRFGLSPKYSRYIGIASYNHVLRPM